MVRLGSAHSAGALALPPFPHHLAELGADGVSASGSRRCCLAVAAGDPGAAQLHDLRLQHVLLARAVFFRNVSAAHEPADLLGHCGAEPWDLLLRAVAIT